MTLGTDGARSALKELMFRREARLFWLNRKRNALPPLHQLNVHACVASLQVCWWKQETQRAQRSKKFDISIGIENFEREWHFRASHPPRPYFLVGKSRRRDWNFRARSKNSIGIKNFDRDQKFRSGSNVFDRWALWENQRRAWYV